MRRIGERDEQVEAVQIWINETYGDIFKEHGYDLLDIDGHTGWDVVNGLIMGLQIELGISAIAPTFGPTTVEHMDAYGPVGEGLNDSNLNIVKIINGGGWCTGYYPGQPIDYVTEFDADMTAEAINLSTDIGIEPLSILGSSMGEMKGKTSPVILDNSINERLIVGFEEDQIYTAIPFKKTAYINDHTHYLIAGNFGATTVYTQYTD